MALKKTASKKGGPARRVLPFLGRDLMKIFNVIIFMLVLAAMIRPGAAAPDDSALSEIVFYVQ